jgi:hypothetical protein
MEWKAALAAVPVVAALALLPSAAARAADPMLAAAGDIACPTGSTSDSTNCEQALTAALLQAQAPTAVAPLGDEQYDSGTLTEFDAAGAFDRTWGKLPPRFHPVPGNHEYADTTAAGYFSYFGAAAGPAGGYYSYDLGQWHLVALNSNCDDSGCANHDSNDGAVTTAEAAWLKTDLDQHAGMCTLAYWHHPLFSSGQIGDSAGVKPLWTELYAHRADVILNGHEHHYERFAPQDPTGTATTAGIAEFVVGTGGHDIGSDTFTTPAAANSEVRDYAHFGALLLTLHPHSYDWAFKAADGSTIDSGSSLCHAQPPLATTGPPSAVAQTNATLSGTVDPRGEQTTYRFETGTTPAYGTSTAPGTAAGAGPVAAAVGGLARGTTYHFRLVATNASGTTAGADAVLTTAAVPEPAPAPPAPAPPEPAPPPPAARLRVVAPRNVAALLRHGLRISLTCPSACSGRGALETRLRRRRAVLGRGRRSIGRTGTATLTIKLNALGRRRLRQRGGTLTVVVNVTLADGTRRRLEARLTLPSASRAAVLRPPLL